MGDFLLTHRGMIPQRVMLLYSIISKNLNVLFAVSVEPDEIETSSIFFTTYIISKKIITFTFKPFDLLKVKSK